MTIGEVQALNTIGAELLESGDLKQAASALSRALALLSQQCSATASSPPTTRTTNTTEGESDSSPSSALSESLSSSSSSRTSSLIIYSSNEEDDELRDPRVNQIFADPQLFESEQATHLAEQPLTHDEQSRCAICCLFNLGLCFHLEWQRSPRKSNLLVRAGNFYRQAFALALGITPLRPTDDVLKVLLPVCSNATQCHWELGNHGEVVAWNRKLSDILSYSQVTTRNNQYYFSTHAFLNSFPRVAANAA